ncbi:MAG: glycosyl transferase family 90 [Rikenellaceae bacterium]
MSKNYQEYIIGRVNYYNKLSGKIDILVGKATDGTEMVYFDKLKLGAVFNGKKSHSVYVFDTYEYTRFFNQRYKAGFLFGDITETPLTPSFVKSRPIEGNNMNSVLLPLDKIRHFTFVKDNKKFTDKKNILVGRAFVDQPHRKKFWEAYFGHPMCNLGNINRKLSDHQEWLVSPMPIDDHLEYKFILCLEGNDVASNLKWVMSSNSLAVMPKPKYESWYMEGCLIPNFHYVEINSDYSDLEERLNYYIDHPIEAQEIINNAHKYVNQFRRKKIERIIGFMTVNKYLICTGQKR